MMWARSRLTSLSLVYIRILCQYVSMAVEHWCMGNERFVETFAGQESPFLLMP